jgi:hypothetical protein
MQHGAAESNKMVAALPTARISVRCCYLHRPLLAVSANTTQGLQDAELGLFLQAVQQGKHVH